jgi:hypothetical protein
MWENYEDVHHHSTLLQFPSLSTVFFIQSFHNLSQTDFHLQGERTIFNPGAAYNYSVNSVLLIVSRLRVGNKRILVLLPEETRSISLLERAETEPGTQSMSTKNVLLGRSKSADPRQWQFTAI